MKALSVRQPGAWLIVNGFKDIENRTWLTHFRGEILIHASAGMTRGDYEAAVLFCASIPDDESKHALWLPSREVLRSQMGGIVGACQIVDCVTESDSPWFVGPYGWKIEKARKLNFFKTPGSLGLFNVPGVNAQTLSSLEIKEAA